MNDEEKSKLCIQCQKCCRQMRFPLPQGVTNDMDTLQFFKARGVRVLDVVRNGRTYNWASVKIDCPHITPMGCNIYPVRPKVCRIFDGSKDFELGQECLWNKRSTVEERT